MSADDNLDREPIPPESEEARAERLASIGAFMERFGGLIAPGPARVETHDMPVPPGAPAVTALVVYSPTGAHVTLWTNQALEQACRDVLAALGVELAEPPKLTIADQEDLRRMERGL